mgnify:CR=1 FL=1|tara:strand:- start:27959 stop:28159 length:201 start_codon:yes stop_codon:yes gene_type:complete
MYAKDLREKTLKELKETLKELKMDAFNLRWQKVSAEFNQDHKFKDIKKNIARILTIVKEKSYNDAV